MGTNNLKLPFNFYQNILDLTLYKDQGVCLIFNINSKNKIVFCVYISIVHDDISPIITLITDDIDENYKRLLKMGVDIPDEPNFNQKFNIFHILFKNPNGYTIEIQEFLD